MSEQAKPDYFHTAATVAVTAAVIGVGALAYNYYTQGAAVVDAPVATSDVKAVAKEAEAAPEIVSEVAPEAVGEEVSAPAATGAGSEPTEMDEPVLVEVGEKAHYAITKTKMIAIVAHVVEAAKKLRADIEDQVEKGELMRSMAPTIVQMRIQSLDAAIAKKFMVTKEQIEEAQEVYQHDPAVAPSMKVLQEQTELAIMGGKGPEPTWDEETMIEHIKANAAMTLTILMEKKEELLATGVSGEEAKMQFATAMQQMLPQVAMESISRIGVDPAEMQTNMMAYRSNARVMDAMMSSAQNLQGSNMEALTQF